MNEAIHLEKITLLVVSLVTEVAEFISGESKKFSSSDIEMKGVHNLVTYVDKEAEKKIVSGLSDIIPQAGFIAEEDQSLKRAATYNWVIDPLDGTTNFIHGLPPYSISIALLKNNIPVVGVIYEINLKECYYAWESGPAYLNGKTIGVSKTKLLNNSLLATGFPYCDYDRIKPYMQLLEDLMKSTRGIRRLGSAAVDLAYVACGRFDAFYEYGLNPWDIAAGILIVKQAGGMVTDFNNGENYLFGTDIIASNNLVHKEFHNKVKQYFDQI